jgi:hypothetical protein
MHAVARKTLEHVGMQVNQTRCDNLARHFMDAASFLAGDGGCNTRNLAILDGNIVDSVQANRWVHHGTTFE